MFKSLLSVGGFTLVSRLTGFIRDIFITAFLGQNDLSDAYNVAARLPNQFRAIFGEGAFNAAFTPAYSRVLEQGGNADARLFSEQIFSMLLFSQLVFLALAYVFMPGLVYLLASGYAGETPKFALTVTLSRITFPYLLCMTLVTYYSALLNVHRRFAIAAFAPVLMNIAIVGFLLVAYMFPNAAYAASWGILVSGVAQLCLLAWSVRRLGLLSRIVRPRLTHDVGQFFRALGPAVIGSAGVQIAILADTQMASFLGSGALSSISNADRLYQLPIGVIGIAAGTVLLPQMSRLRAAGQGEAAFASQNRVMAVTLALGMPFCIAFLTIPDVIMQGAFMRGKFDAADAHASALVLAAYAVGLLAIVLIRSVVASFQSIGDTRTPMIISLFALTINIGLKFVLSRSLGASGLALATAIGAFLNFSLLAFFAMRRNLMKVDDMLVKAGACTVAGALGLNLLVLLGSSSFDGFTRIGPEVKLIVAGVVGAIVYGLAFVLCARVVKFRLSFR